MKLTKGGDVEMPALIFDEEQVKQVIDRVVERTFQMHYSWDWPGGVAFTEYAKRMKRQGTKSI